MMRRSLTSTAPEHSSLFSSDPQKSTPLLSSAMCGCTSISQSQFQITTLCKAPLIGTAHTSLLLHTACSPSPPSNSLRTSLTSTPAYLPSLLQPACTHLPPCCTPPRLPPLPYTACTHLPPLLLMVFAPLLTACIPLPRLLHTACTPIPRNVARHRNHALTRCADWLRDYCRLAAGVHDAW